MKYNPKKFNGGEFNLSRTAVEVLKSDNPAKWVAGIALAVIAVGGYAIKTIRELA